MFTSFPLKTAAVASIESAQHISADRFQSQVSCDVKLNASPKSSRRAWSDASYSVDAGDLVSNIGDFASDSNIRFGKRSFRFFFIWLSLNFNECIIENVM